MARTAVERQLGLIANLMALDPAPWLMGGFAEDALLAGAPTRPHEDVDLAFPRRELGLRLEQLGALGFEEFETWGEAAPGEPFYLFGDNGNVKLDLGICDEEDGRLWVKVHSLTFTVDGGPAPAGYRFELPADTFSHPPACIGEVAVRVVSPLALWRLREGFAREGSFGELSDRQRAASRRLLDRFYPGHDPDDLMPRIERLRPPATE